MTIDFKNDPRYEYASQHAKEIMAKCEELSTAIYQAHKMGYDVKLQIKNATQLREGLYFSNGDQMDIKGTIIFDIGKAVG